MSTLKFAMQQVNLGYSTKNIPIPSEEEYLMKLTHSAGTFMHAIRWRVAFFLHPEWKSSQKQTYGFRSRKNPGRIEELAKFEEGIVRLIQNIVFRNSDNEFQQKMRKDIASIRKDEKLLIAADKTTNFYKLEPEKYRKLLEENISKDYQKAPQNIEDVINRGNKTIARDLDLDDRINITANKEAFITLKDHKLHFLTAPKCRLINPMKSEIEKISKQILDRVNSRIREKTKLNQWRNTNDVIKWFRNIREKEKCLFVGFDVVEFYPSITDDLLTRALHFAQKYDEITDQEIRIIKHSKISVLCSNDKLWCKKGNSQFDVTMGSSDGAECCELVGLFLLDQLKALDIDIGLYRDDGLGVAVNKTQRQVDLIKKEICKIFSSNSLKVTIEANLKVVDFLDITMNLVTKQYQPFMKPNNTPLYVHKHSNHPPSITKNIPESVNRRLSSISSSDDAFRKTTAAYQIALNNSKYKHQLKYNPQAIPDNNEGARSRKKRKRKVSWFNPPYSSNVATNVAKQFLNLLDTCFPPLHPLHAIMNRNTVKVSYCTMPNIKQIITAHNKKILRKADPQPPPGCNCRDKKACPLDGQCKTRGIVYQATVTRKDNNKKETYIGMTDTTFKERYYNHTSSFRKNEAKHRTTLSHYVWKLKNNNIEHNITWKIITKKKSYSPATDQCNLCLAEKYFITRHPELSTLNNRNELAATCPHKRKFLLCYN